MCSASVVVGAIFLIYTQLSVAVRGVRENILSFTHTLERQYQLVPASMPAQLEQYRESALPKDPITQRNEFKPSTS